MFYIRKTTRFLFDGRPSTALTPQLRSTLTLTFFVFFFIRVKTEKYPKSIMMKDMLMLVCLAVLLTSYVSGRSLKEKDEDPVTDYDNCMMKCEELFNACKAKYEEGDNGEAMDDCKVDRTHCESGQPDSCDKKFLL